MNIARVVTDKGTHWALTEDGFFYEAIGDPYSGALEKGDPIGGMEVVVLLPPCEPHSITSIGANYASRCEENHLPIPTEPGGGDRFLIPVDTLVASGGLIYLPAGEQRVEYGGELGIVMREDCRTVSVDEASDKIFGYTILNNVWAKDSVGSTSPDSVRAYPSFCPTGPFVVTGIDPMNLNWETRINGEVRQRSNTSEMLFSPAEIVSSVSSWHSLKRGDLIQCGTASGVSVLKPGDVIEIEVESIGTLRNLVVSRSGLQKSDLIWIEYAGG